MKLQVLTTTPPNECGIAQYSQRLYNRPDWETEMLGDGEVWEMGSASSAKNVLNQVKGGLLHVQHEWMMYGGPTENVIPISALLQNKRKGGTNVTTLHTVIPEESITRSFLENFNAGRFPVPVVRACIKRLTELYVRYSNQVIVHTPEAKKHLSDNYNAQNVRVVPHGLEIKQRTSVSSTPSFLYIGLINKSKGVNYLLNAVDSIGSELDITIAGRVESDSISDPRITDEFLSTQKYFNLIQSHDVLVLPYIKGEYFAASGVLSDAIACGKAVIVSDIPQLSPEVTDNQTGLVVPPADSNALAEKIRIAAENPELLEHFGARLHERAKNRTWPEVQTMTESIYTEARA